MIAKVFLIPLFAVAATAIAGQAQSTDGVGLELRPGSELSFEGTSTLHAFHCKTTKLQAMVQVDAAYSEAILQSVYANGRLQWP